MAYFPKLNSDFHERESFVIVLEIAAKTIDLFIFWMDLHRRKAKRCRVSTGKVALFKD